MRARRRIGGVAHRWPVTIRDQPEKNHYRYGESDDDNRRQLLVILQKISQYSFLPVSATYGQDDNWRRPDYQPEQGGNRDGRSAVLRLVGDPRPIYLEKEYPQPRGTGHAPDNDDILINFWQGVFACLKGRPAGPPAR